MQSTGTAILLATHDAISACLSSRAAVHFRHCFQSGRLASEWNWAAWLMLPDEEARPSGAVGAVYRC